MKRAAFALAVLAAAVLGAFAVSPAVPAGAAGARHCGAFDTQAEAQEYFLEIGGGPGHDVGQMDRDHNGVACEGLGGSYAGYATVGFNRHGQFFYGTATMPPGEKPGAEAPCLIGNSHFPMAARQLRLYRVTSQGPQRVLSHPISAEARPNSRRLIWKAPERAPVQGSYYVEFEEKIRLSPYGENECPGFVSRPEPLPTVPAKR